MEEELGVRTGAWTQRCQKLGMPHVGLQHLGRGKAGSSLGLGRGMLAGGNLARLHDHVDPRHLDGRAGRRQAGARGSPFAAGLQRGCNENRRAWVPARPKRRSIHSGGSIPAAAGSPARHERQRPAQTQTATLNNKTHVANPCARLHCGERRLSCHDRARHRGGHRNEVDGQLELQGGWQRQTIEGGRL